MSTTLSFQIEIMAKTTKILAVSFNMILLTSRGIIPNPTHNNTVKNLDFDIMINQTHSLSVGFDFKENGVNENAMLLDVKDSICVCVLYVEKKALPVGNIM